MQKYIDSIRRGWRRPEVRHHPLQAIARRLLWRWHWRRSPGVPIVLNNWWRDLKIALPHTSNASLLFYRLHSDPTLVWLLQKLLSPRMTFLDVGAHIGEFTLVGAKMVGGEGKVIAVEPLPPCAEAIRHNAALNGMAQVQVYEGALANCSGKIGFRSDSERSGGWIARSADQAAFEARCWSLDDFLAQVGITAVDVAKLDASGNELAVLRGAAKTLPAGRVRTLVMKLYNPDVVRERFGYDAHESVALLRQWGFQLKLVVRQEEFPVCRDEDVDSHFDRLVYSHLLVATVS